MKDVLGKGFAKLFTSYEESEEEQVKPAKKEAAAASPAVSSSSDEVVKGEQIKYIDTAKIYANPNQPRKRFDDVALSELSASIKIHGVVQPIVVNKTDDGFMIVAGERRWRAAKMAEIGQIPCIVKSYGEKQIKEIAIIENLQREDLNPIEAARAVKQLMEEYKFTQEAVADRIGKSRPAVANFLRLLTLPNHVLELVESDKLSAGHARCLIPLQTTEDRIKTADYAVKKKLSVRDLEKLVKEILSPDKRVRPEAFEQSIELKEMVNELQKMFATKVSAIGNDRKGRIYIDYYSKDDLDRICGIIELVKKKELTLKDLQNYNKRK